MWSTGPLQNQFPSRHNLVSYANSHLVIVHTPQGDAKRALDEDHHNVP